jgi:CDGSH-type Zn-finger protein
MAEPRHGTQPICVEETPGRKLPYCDGSHKRLNTGCHPIKLEVTEAGTKWLCQCHRSGDLPWCDGTHQTPPGR